MESIILYGVFFSLVASVICFGMAVKNAKLKLNEKANFFLLLGIILIFSFTGIGLLIESLIIFSKERIIIALFLMAPLGVLLVVKKLADISKIKNQVILKKLLDDKKWQ